MFTNKDNSKETSIGIRSMSVWLPPHFQTGEEIAALSGIPEHVVKTKMGIVRKSRATEDMQPSMMAVEAAKKVLVGIDPLSVDMVIWTGSEYKDHIVWSAGIFVQRELGLRNAIAFDIGARCSNKILGLMLAKSLMQTNPNLKRVLLAGGHKTGDLVNYQDPNSRFLYNLADGGSAILLEKGAPNPLLESSFVTDGDFSLDVIVPAGGTKNPTRNHPKVEDTYLQVPDVDGMRQRLERSSIHNFMKVIKEASTQSMNKPIDYLSILHMKKSAHDEILKLSELREDQSIYLDHFGHYGAPDQVLSIGLAERQNKLKKGDHVCLASAGIGYTWSALSIRWDEPTFDQSLHKDLDY
jgi:3-oxoacyl-[acyl-carrier-protein] synthase-3